MKYFEKEKKTKTDLNSSPNLIYFAIFLINRFCLETPKVAFKKMYFINIRFLAICRSAYQNATNKL